MGEGYDKVGKLGGVVLTDMGDYVCSIRCRLECGLCVEVVRGARKVVCV